VWVIDDARTAEAQALVEKAMAAAPINLEAWRCDRCGQVLEGQFTSCWKCEGRIGQVVERLDRSRRREAYPNLLLWIALASMAAVTFAMLNAQYAAWP
jgi:hypothetical protein